MSLHLLRLVPCCTGPDNITTEVDVIAVFYNGFVYVWWEHAPHDVCEYYGLIICERFLILGFWEEFSVFPGKCRIMFGFYEEKYFCIEGMKYFKRLIARDYLIIHRALEKTYPQYILQRRTIQ